MRSFSGAVFGRHPCIPSCDVSNVTCPCGSRISTTSSAKLENTEVEQYEAQIAVVVNKQNLVVHREKTQETEDMPDQAIRKIFSYRTRSG